MSVLQNIALAASTVKMRWQEPYITSGLNEKSLAAFPKGVVSGFRVVPSSGYSVEIQPDPALGMSIANVVDTTGATKFGVTVNQPGSVYVDLTAQAGLTVFIALDAQYAVGAASAAQIRVVDAAELLLNVDLIILAKVNVPATPIPGPPVTTAHINMGYRTASGDSLSREGSPPVNLIANGTFERDALGGPPKGWSNYAGIAGPSLSPTVNNVVPRTGTQCLALFSAAPVTSGMASTPVPMQEGQLARASVWLRSMGGTPITGGAGVVATVVWLDDAYSEIASSNLEGSFTGGSVTYEQRLSEVTAPAGTAFAQLLVFYSACSGSLFIDDAEFVVRAASGLATSAVFGGSTSIADQYHTHTSAGMSYAGGPAWADGTLNSGAGYPSTIEAQIDKILSDLAGTSGAPKVGNAPSKILSNVFVNTVPNGVSIDAQGGPGNGHGVIGRAGTGGSGSGVIGYGRGSGVGGAFVGEGAVMPAYSGQGLVAAGSDTFAGSSVGIFGLGGLPSGHGVHGRARGTGVGVVGEGAVGSSSVGVYGHGRELAAGGYFDGGTSAGAPFGGPGVIAQGYGSKEGIYAEGGSGGGAGAYCVGNGGGPGVYGRSSANGWGGTFYGNGIGGGVFAEAGATGTGVFAYGGTTSGTAVYAEARGGNTAAVYGQGHGSTGAVLGLGQANVGTNTFRPNGFGGGGGSGLPNGLTTSQGGDGADIQGGSAELLPPIDSASGPYYRGSAGHGVIGRAGSGRVGGNGIYGFGSVGYEAYELDPTGASGWGVFGQGAGSVSDVSNAPYAHAGGGVFGVGGDSDLQLLAGHGVRGQNGTDVFPFGGDGACFFATPTTTSAKALLIDNTGSKHGAIAYKVARPMVVSLMGGAWNALSYADQSGSPAQGWIGFGSSGGPSFTANAAGVTYYATAHFRLPLNAVITQVQWCVSHSGQIHFAGGGTVAAISKQWPNGTAIGGTTFGTANGQTPAMSAGASTQVFTLTLGTLAERTVTALDQSFTVEVQATSFDASAAFSIKYMKISYDMYDHLWLPG